MFNPNVSPLAQDFVIAAQVPDPVRYFFHDPDLTRLDDGTLLLAAPQWHRPGWDHSRRLRLLRSDDGGLTWVELPGLPYEEATPFVLDGQLLMFVQEKCHKDFLVVSSDDRGPDLDRSRDGHRGSHLEYLHVPGSAPRGALLDNGLRPAQPGATAERRCSEWIGACHPWIREHGRFPISCGSRRSRPAMTRDLFPDGNRPQLSGGWRDPLVWLEPNTVEVCGRIRAFCRCVFDEYAAAHVAAVFDYDPEAHQLSFTQFAAWPGAQCKFYVIHDHSASMYWMLSNLITNSQDLLGWGERMRESGYHGGPGNERRWLYLHYSIDCLNWFPAGCVARWPDNVYRSFMYPSAVVDGDDFVVLSRTSRDSGDQHDADLCTIHRIRNYRSLAMDLHAGGLY